MVMWLELILVFLLVCNALLMLRLLRLNLLPKVSGRNAELSIRLTTQAERLSLNEAKMQMTNDRLDGVEATLSYIVQAQLARSSTEDFS